MTTMTSQITSLTVVYSTVYSDADQRKHQSSASLAFVRWIPRRKGQLRGKRSHLMTSWLFSVFLWYYIWSIVRKNRIVDVEQKYSKDSDATFYRVMLCYHFIEETKPSNWNASHNISNPSAASNNHLQWVIMNVHPIIIVWLYLSVFDVYNHERVIIIAIWLYLGYQHDLLKLPNINHYFV